jgi:hypothetical protein
MKKMFPFSIYHAIYMPIYKTLLFFFIILLPIQIRGDEKKDLEGFIDLYFKSWSRGDMVVYKKLFHPNAVIQFKDKSGWILSDNLENFVEGQKISQLQANELLTEIPTSKTIDIGKEVSFARVTWKLTGRGKLVTGWDYFVILKAKDGYKIQYLLFSND